MACLCTTMSVSGYDLGNLTSLERQLHRKKTQDSPSTNEASVDGGWDICKVA